MDAFISISNFFPSAISSFRAVAPGRQPRAYTHESASARCRINLHEKFVFRQTTATDAASNAKYLLFFRIASEIYELEMTPQLGDKNVDCSTLCSALLAFLFYPFVLAPHSRSANEYIVVYVRFFIQLLLHRPPHSRQFSFCVGSDSS